MPTREQALSHSPALWGLYAGGAAFAGIVALTVGWNLWDHRADVRRWLKL